MKNNHLKNILLIILIAIITSVIFFYQTKKVGFHEDEVYSVVSAVNPINGLMWAYGDPWETGLPIWLTRQYVTDFVTLSPENYFNTDSVIENQESDNHPPFFYLMVHFSSILFNGDFSKYTVFVVNIIAFILSCFVIIGILKQFNKKDLAFPTLIFYGLSMGTISMVTFQRMYMLLTFFILLYFYLTLRIYINNFKISIPMLIMLGLTTIFGFLTQYFFAIFAFFVVVLMLIKMVITRIINFKKENDNKLLNALTSIRDILLYIVCHLVSAVIAINNFKACVEHLNSSDRGISNLGNGDYLSQCWEYVRHLAYAFSINNNYTIILVLALIIFFGFVIYLFIKSKEKFMVALCIVPSIFYFFVVVYLTSSFQELRYMMPILPFISLAFILILDKLYDDIILPKYNSQNLKISVLTCISFVLVLFGFVFSKPLYLYEDYQANLDIAEENKDKSFVYIYDNFFNHMQSIPEMMIYDKSLIINIASEYNDEFNFMLNNEELNNEDSYILSIKNYLDNDAIIEQIKNNTDFKNFKLLYESGTSEFDIWNNLYLVSK